MDILRPILLQVFPNGSTYLTATALSVWIILSTSIIKIYWREWMTYRKQPDPTIPNIVLVVITFLMGYTGVVIGLIEIGQLSNSASVAKAFILANSTAFTTNGIYSIIKHSVIPWAKN